MNSAKRNLSLYFPEKMLREIGGEATRQDRSMSWIFQQAWKEARKKITGIWKRRTIRARKVDAERLQ